MLQICSEFGEWFMSLVVCLLVEWFFFVWFVPKVVDCVSFFYEIVTSSPLMPLLKFVMHKSHCSVGHVQSL